MPPRTLVPLDVHIHWTFAKPNIKTAKPQLHEDSTNVLEVIDENNVEDEFDPEELVTNRITLKKLTKLLNVIFEECKINGFKCNVYYFPLIMSNFLVVHVFIQF